MPSAGTSWARLSRRMKDGNSSYASQTDSVIPDSKNTLGAPPHPTGHTQRAVRSLGHIWPEGDAGWRLQLASRSANCRMVLADCHVSDKVPALTDPPEGTPAGWRPQSRIHAPTARRAGGQHRIAPALLADRPGHPRPPGRAGWAVRSSSAWPMTCARCSRPRRLLPGKPHVHARVRRAWPEEAVVQQAVGQIPWGHNIVCS